MHEMRQHHHERQRLGREHHLLDQPRVGVDGVGRLERGRGEERPRQNAGEEKQRIRLDGVGRKENSEDDGVDREQQQRIGQRPEKPEDRAAVAGLQIAGGEGRDELAVAVEVAELVHGVGSDE